MSEVSLQERVQSSTQSQKLDEAMRTKRWRTDLAGWGFVLPFLIVYAIFLIWPFINGLRMSFFNWSITGSGSADFLGLGNYQELFSDPFFWKALGVTLFFTVLSTPLLVLLGLGLALLVNRALPAQWLFRTIFFASFVLPVSVVALTWNWLYQPGFGLINSTLTSLGLPEVGWLSDPNVALISVVILTIWWTVGFNFVLYLAGMQQIPQELQEAAAIDGANEWARIRQITIPLLNRTTALILVLQVIASLLIFNQAYTLFNAGTGPAFSTQGVVQYVYRVGFSSFRLGLASAMSYVLFILILIVSIAQFWILTRQRRDA